MDDRMLGIKYHNSFRGEWNLAIDIGANKGHYSELYTRLFSTVAGIEPNEDLIPLYTNLKKRFNNFNLYTQGIGDNNQGAALFYKCSDSALSGFDLDYINKNIYEFHGDNPDIEISYNLKGTKVQTLDSFMHDFYPKIQLDFLKIDAEGLGPAIIKGGASIIEKYAPTIQIECGHERSMLHDIGYICVAETLDNSDSVYIHASKLINKLESKNV